MTSRKPAHPERFISASELGEYAYCRRAWWLRAVKHVPSVEASARFAAGHAAHRRHGLSLLVARALALVAALLVLAALVLAALVLALRSRA